MRVHTFQKFNIKFAYNYLSENGHNFFNFCCISKTKTVLCSGYMKESFEIKFAYIE